MEEKQADELLKILKSIDGSLAVLSESLLGTVNTLWRIQVALEKLTENRD